jgi:hypothetical protein
MQLTFATSAGFAAFAVKIDDRLDNNSGYFVIFVIIKLIFRAIGPLEKKNKINTVKHQFNNKKIDKTKENNRKRDTYRS